MSLLDEDIHKTAIVAGEGFYHFLKMQFVMKHSGATFRTRKLFQQLKQIENHIDDTKSWDTHLQMMDEL